MAAISFVEFEKALTALHEVLSISETQSEPVMEKISRDAAIQRFKFCIELAWKLSAKILGSQSTTAKPVIREMAQNGFIASPEVWFDFIEARNKSSHSYDEIKAKEVFSAAQVFLPEGLALVRAFSDRGHAGIRKNFRI